MLVEANARAPTQSNLQACLAIETNPWLQRRASAVYELGKALRLAHGLQSQENRGHAASLSYWSSMANGLELDSVKHCLGCMQSGETLSRLGFLLSRVQIGAPMAIDEHILAHEVELEREGLDETFKLAWSYVENRLKGELHAMYSVVLYEGNTCHSSGTSLAKHFPPPPEQERIIVRRPLVALDRLPWSACGIAALGRQRLWDRAAEASETHSLLRTLLQESPWNTPYARALLQQLAVSDFATVSADLRNQLEHVFGIGQTKIVEDLFHALRTDMNRIEGIKDAITGLRPHLPTLQAQIFTVPLLVSHPPPTGKMRMPTAKKDMSHTRKWATAVREVTKLHHFEHVSWKSVDRNEPGMSQKVFPAKVFNGLQHPTTVDCRGIVGETKNAKPKWPSFSAKGATAEMGNWVAIDGVCDSDEWASLEMSWHCLLLPAGCLLKGPATGNEWVFSMGALGMRSLMCWPASVSSTPYGKAYYPCLDVTKCDLQLVVVTSVADMVVQNVQWCGPIWQEAQASMKSSSSASSAGVKDCGTSRVLGLPFGKPTSCMENAASHCFWQLPNTFLNKLASVYHIDIPKGADTYTLLESLVKFWLPDLSDAELLGIMHKRLKRADHDDADIIDSKMLAEVLEEEDIEDFAVEERQNTSKKIAMAAYTNKVAKLRSKVHSQHTKPGKKKKEAEKKKEPEIDEYTKISIDMARKFVPEPFNLVKDARNGRWYGRTALYSVSRSFKKYSESVALALVLDSCYQYVGIECPHPWIHRLVATASAAA
eukprot:4853248-Amphidinium_carterae.2